MQFNTNDTYHVYNRGNNSQAIFFTRNNYLFFLKKVRSYILPHADILAWCLMPNHFHLMIYVHSVAIEIKNDQTGISNSLKAKTRLLNDSVGIVLRSYARAIQKQESRTGSLFQNRTKAICVNEIHGVTPAWVNTLSGTSINIPDAEKEYLQILFNYIHFNPVNAGLVEVPEEWEFSSAKDYAGMRDGTLINCKRTAELGLIY